MKYRCMEMQRFQAPPYEIVPIRLKDMLCIKTWRNAQMAVLRQKRVITDDEQQSYWLNVLKPSFELKQPHQILFSYLQGDVCIGYGGMTYIDWDSKQAEVSFLLNPLHKRDPTEYEIKFLTFLALITKVAFEEFKFNRLFTETFDIRPHHIAVLEKFGFKLEEKIKAHVNIEGHFVDSLIHGYLRRDYGVRSK